jgi:Dam-replacing family/Dam-replacing HTH domain
MRYGMGQLFDYRVRYEVEVAGAEPVLAFGALPDRATGWITNILQDNGIAFVARDREQIVPLNARFNAGLVHAAALSPTEIEETVLSKTVTWKDLVHDVVSMFPRDFSLADVLKNRERFERAFPNNRFIDAKIRQSLQVLRDQGVLRFVSPGRYQRLDVAPVFSPLIDMSVTSRFVSAAQATRVALETWASFNLYCLNCERDELDQLPDNTPVADFECWTCKSRYQLKGKNGRLGRKIPGAAYKPTIDAIRAGKMPEYVLVEFDTRFATVVFVDAFPGRRLTEDRIEPRTPLLPTARRAGWQGCNIIINGLENVRIVAPAGLDRVGVREKWRSL